MGQENVKEIERKWIITEDLFNRLTKDHSRRVITRRDITQSYLFTTGDGDHRIECRLRKSSRPLDGKCDYVIDIKTGSGLIRSEVTKELSLEEYNELVKSSIHSIEKEYYRMFLGGNFVDLSSVNKGKLYYLEVEFKTTEESEKFSLDETLSSYLDQVYVSQEVTGDDQWSMSKQSEALRQMIEVGDQK